MLEICEFTFTSHVDFQFVHAKGIESSWYDLKHKFNEEDAQLYPTASYYETFSIRGPRFFAIINYTSVFYYNDGKWHKYLSATNITCNLNYGLM